MNKEILDKILNQHSKVLIDNDFEKAYGIDIGENPLENDLIEIIHIMIAIAEENNLKMIDILTKISEADK